MYTYVNHVCPLWWCLRWLSLVSMGWDGLAWVRFLRKNLRRYIRVSERRLPPRVGVVRLIFKGVRHSRLALIWLTPCEYRGRHRIVYPISLGPGHTRARIRARVSLPVCCGVIFFFIPMHFPIDATIAPVYLLLIERRNQRQPTRPARQCQHGLTGSTRGLTDRYTSASVTASKR